MDAQNALNVLKAAYYTLLGWLTSMYFYFAPIHGIIIGLSIAFGLSFFSGLIAGLVVQKESFDFKKAFNAFIEITVYFVFVSSLFTIGEKMKGGEWVYEILSAISWGLIYFYFTNLTKNVKRILPKSRAIAFLHYVLSLEFIKKVPYLKDFEEHEKKNKHHPGKDDFQNT